MEPGYCFLGFCDGFGFTDDGASESEISPPLVHLDFADLLAVDDDGLTIALPGKRRFHNQLDAATTRRNLRISIAGLDDFLRPKCYCPGVGIAAIIEIDAAVRVALFEHI